MTKDEQDLQWLQDNGWEPSRGGAKRWENWRRKNVWLTVSNGRWAAECMEPRKKGAYAKVRVGEVSMSGYGPTPALALTNLEQKIINWLGYLKDKYGELTGFLLGDGVGHGP
jgi:hypothetical protein